MTLAGHDRQTAPKRHFRRPKRVEVETDAKVSNAQYGALCNHDWQLPMAVICGSAFPVLKAVSDCAKARKKAVILAYVASKFSVDSFQRLKFAVLGFQTAPDSLSAIIELKWAFF